MALAEAGLDIGVTWHSDEAGAHSPAAQSGGHQAIRQGRVTRGKSALPAGVKPYQRVVGQR